ncbi:uncharacterized protein LOC128557487 [Mercenaria mercenaria]|uniref:uncharacterized protein LOC128557487 n=1 Tax=Mercenaria mercenaria TaxID=6596 RepID=UPI00234EC03A|nr:uncharacterized protein LOC128557487 [Mercenaria mercenaria]
MTWPEVLHLVSRKLQDCTYRPDAKVIHCGGNSLGKIPKGFLAKQVRNDLSEIRKLAGPTTLLIWSNILPRLNWLSNIYVGRLEDCRKKINRAAALQVFRLGGCWIKHCQITADTPCLLRSDGIHLSDIGLDIFNLSIKEAIESVMSENLKAVFE